MDEDADDEKGENEELGSDARFAFQTPVYRKIKPPHLQLCQIIPHESFVIRLKFCVPFRSYVFPNSSWRTHLTEIPAESEFLSVARNFSVAFLKTV